MQENNFNFEDISSSKKKSYEDIVSDTSRYYVSTNNRCYKGKHYKRKKHGLAKILSDKRNRNRKSSKRMKKGKRRAIIAVASLLLILIVMISTFFIMFNYNYRGITTDPSKLGFKSVIDENVINVALFGIDSRDTKGKTSFKGNSDSIMILSINTKTKRVKIISLMRDTLVPIERDTGLTYNKLNCAYSWGGPELAIKTLNQNFGLDISEYATVNFYGMSDIIDAVGGIDATLTDDEVTSRGVNNHGINDMIEEICQYEKLKPKDYYVTVSGNQHLNGIQAVAYARIRYCKNIWGTSNDYGRTDRQRYVMEQLFEKAKEMGKGQSVKLAQALIPCTETSLSYSQIIGIAFNVMFDSPIFEQYRIPQNTPEMNFLMPSPSGSFGSVVYFDLDYASSVIKAIIYDDMTIEEYVAEHPIEKNNWYAKRGGSSDTKSYSGSSQTVVDNKPTENNDSTTNTQTDTGETIDNSEKDTAASEQESTVENETDTPESDDDKNIDTKEKTENDKDAKDKDSEDKEKDTDTKENDNSEKSKETENTGNDNGTDVAEGGNGNTTTEDGE